MVSIIGEKKFDFWPIVSIHRLKIFSSSDDHRFSGCFLPSIDYRYRSNRCFFDHRCPTMIKTIVDIKEIMVIQAIFDTTDISHLGHHGYQGHHNHQGHPEHHSLRVIKKSKIYIYITDITNIHRWARLLEQRMLITVYRCWPRKTNFCFPQKTNGSLPFLCVCVCVYIYKYICCFKQKTEARNIFPESVYHLLTVQTGVCRLSVCWWGNKRKLSVCKRTKRTCPSMLILQALSMGRYTVEPDPMNS